MKRISCLILTLVMLFAFSTTAFAAGVPASKEQQLVPVNGTVGESDNVGWLLDAYGAFFRMVSEKEVTLTTLTEEPAGLKTKISSIESRLGGNNQLTVVKMFDIKLSDELEQYLQEKGSITLRFKLDLKSNETLHVLHNYEADQWEEITGSRLVINDDGTVDVTFYSLNPVVFAVSTKTAADAQGAPTSPATGLPVNHAATAVVVIVAAFCGIVALRRKEG